MFSFVLLLSHNWGVLWQKQVSRAGTINYILQTLWDVITCPCPWCFLCRNIPQSLVDHFDVFTKLYIYIYQNYSPSKLTRCSIENLKPRIWYQMIPLGLNTKNTKYNINDYEWIALWLYIGRTYLLVGHNVLIAKTAPNAQRGYELFMPNIKGVYRDDAMTQTRFHHYWPFVDQISFTKGK